jgi:hypothetical protein
MSITISRAVPLPPERPEPLALPFDQLDVGDSFLVDGFDLAHRVHNQCHTRNACDPEVWFTCRHEGAGTPVGRTR